MQDVEFVIRKPERLSWHPVVLQIEQDGYEVKDKPSGSSKVVVLSGTYLNPMFFEGEKVLVAHPQEWGTMWEVMYKPVLEEYYDT